MFCFHGSGGQRWFCARLSLSIIKWSAWLSMTEFEGRFLLTTQNAVVPIERIYSVNTYLLISLSHEGVSEVSERAHEWSKQVKRTQQSRALQSE